MALATAFPVPHDSADRAAVLTKAALRAADRLGLSAARLARVVGVSEPTLSRMKQGGAVLAEGTKPFELAAIFVRVFRSLDAITGGDERVAKDWMKTPNTALQGVPSDLIQTVTGLVDVAAYLDARRAVL